MYPLQKEAGYNQLQRSIQHLSTNTVFFAGIIRYNEIILLANNM